MATITPDNLKALAPKILPERATAYAPALDACLAAAEINTPLRVAHFMAQLAHESGGFRALVENLSYSAERLTQVFPSRVKTLAQAQQLVAAGKPAIAEAIYGNRSDLGNVNPGDGYKYIGRGFIMITGRSNYTHFGQLISQPLADHPELLEQPGIAAQASAAYWKSRNINAAADRDDITTVTRLINGGTVGLDARKALLATAKTIWLSPIVPMSGPSPINTAPAGAPNYVYEQMTGRFLAPDGSLMAVGYSGHEDGLNNPDLEDHQAVGPIPRGDWRISLTPKPDSTHGPYALPVSPVGHNAHGRSGFLIHGDNRKLDHSASLGCIILPSTVRQKIMAAGITALKVVHG